MWPGKLDFFPHSDWAWNVCMVIKDDCETIIHIKVRIIINLYKIHIMVSLISELYCVKRH